MKAMLFNRLAIILLGLLVVLPVTARTRDNHSLSPGPEHARSTKYIIELIQHYHYSKPELNDTISSAMLDRYIESLDPNRQYFLVEDIQSFEKYRYLLDDDMKNSSVRPAFKIYKIFKQRVKDRIDYALEILDDKYDFTVDEEYRIDYENSPWPTDENALKEIWRKRVKNDILNQRLSKKDDNKIQETLRKRYEGVARRVDQQNANDVYQIFINAFANSIDPHSSYFSPHSSENFKINMSLSLEGIGAALTTKNEYTVVQRIIAGGPADISKQLKPRDRIIGVAQDQDEMVDVVGWRLQDVVGLIRGQKGTVVRLSLLPYSDGADAPEKEITLVRDTIKLEEQAAKSSVIENINGFQGIKIGVIDLPTFYLDFDARGRGDPDYRSTTRDVRRLIRELEAKDVSGIVIDLRGNGGGSLIEATELTGLFIKKGPVVQVKDTRGDIEVNSDPDPEVVYDGPLAVLVDRYSASASEIFAGAIQDYGRGIIIGEPTFGKGTVQTLIDLNRFTKGRPPSLGQVKVTIAQFFRINGDSTQHRGVRPDIVYPTVVDIEDHGERSLDNALPWAKVRPARYSHNTSSWFNFGVLRDHHKSRIAKDPGFDYLIGVAKSVKSVQDKEVVTLVEQQRRIERDNIRKQNLDRENQFRQSRGLEALTMADKEKDDDDLIEEDKDDDPIKKIMLDEAAAILADHISMQGYYAVKH
ncbi:MAG: tail-specific protease [Gammaproteobacteria bacterium]|nr:MAG: tail-specific protease [Gammaproteobacteria bacterium]